MDDLQPPAGNDPESDTDNRSVPTEAQTPRGWRSSYVHIVFLTLLLGWPLLSILSQPGDADALAALTSSNRLAVYGNTALILWVVFLLVWSAQWAGRRPLAELGFTQPRFMDPLVALAFLFVANLTLNGLTWVLTTIGTEAPELTVKGLLPESTGERATWIGLSISAGVCEESCFRGFLLLRGKEWLRRWWPIVLLSSAAFGLGHLYQGGSGAVLIFIYGIMFCGLRLWRGSLWPGIWAHVWQDIGAMAFGDWGA